MDDITIEPVRDAEVAVAAGRGAIGLKAITNTESEGSLAFHRRMGFTDIAVVADYAGSGRTRVVMRRPLAPGWL